MKNQLLIKTLSVLFYSIPSLQVVLFLTGTVIVWLNFETYQLLNWEIVILKCLILVLINVYQLFIFSKTRIYLIAIISEVIVYLLALNIGFEKYLVFDLSIVVFKLALFFSLKYLKSDRELVK